MAKVNRVSVDLSPYPDLVVIYLGMRVNSLRGLKTLFSFGPKISASVAAKPDGLLLHENFFFSFFPLHAGMRQYWRDFESLEAWARSMPHQKWWQDFPASRVAPVSGTKPTSVAAARRRFYDDLPKPTGPDAVGAELVCARSHVLSL